jgi:hypothetical protein
MGRLPFLQFYPPFKFQKVAIFFTSLHFHKHRWTFKSMNFQTGEFSSRWIFKSMNESSGLHPGARDESAAELLHASELLATRWPPAGRPLAARWPPTSCWRQPRAAGGWRRPQAAGGGPERVAEAPSRWRRPQPTSSWRRPQAAGRGHERS